MTTHLIGNYLFIYLICDLQVVLPVTIKLIICYYCSFEVTTNYPRRVVPCVCPASERPQAQEQQSLQCPEELSHNDSITFGEFGIAPRTVLFVKDLDA